jgi:hypothetical protein
MFHLGFSLVIMGRIVIANPDGDNAVRANPMTAPACGITKP